MKRPRPSPPLVAVTPETFGEMTQTSKTTVNKWRNEGRLVLTDTQPQRILVDATLEKLRESAIGE